MACGAEQGEDSGSDTEAAVPDEPAARPVKAPAQPEPPLRQPHAPELVTLAMLPTSMWQSLVHLDAIKVRHFVSSPLSALQLSATAPQPK